MSAFVSARTPKWARLASEEAHGPGSRAKRIRAEEQQRENDKEDSSEDEANLVEEALAEMTRSAGSYVAKPKLLPKHHLSATLLKDVTIGHTGNGAIKAIRFHPAKEVMITGTGSGRISLFELCRSDGRSLEMKKGGESFVQDAQFQGFFLDSMEFCEEGRSLLAHSTNKKYCYSYNLMTGSVMQIFLPRVLRELKSSKMAVSADGTYVAHVMGGSDLYVFLLSTMEHLHTFHAHSSIVDVRFFPADRNLIYALTVNGAVYAWDMRNRAGQDYFFDDGCVRATCLAMSPNGQFIACGSNTGIVNVYQMQTAFSPSTTNFVVNEKNEDEDEEAEETPSMAHGQGERKQPKPLHTLTNLTTSALFMSFNHDAQAMAIGSSVKFMAGRMLHCRSGEVFQNFPSRREMFEKERFKCGEFSPNSAFFAAGMESGATRLYRLHHFDKY